VNGRIFDSAVLKTSYDNYNAGYRFLSEQHCKGYWCINAIVLLLTKSFLNTFVCLQF
jgi:hypothetical protein